MALPMQDKIKFQPEKTVSAVLNSSSFSKNQIRAKARKYLFKSRSFGMQSDFKPVETSQLVSLDFKVKGTRDSKRKTSIASETSRLRANAPSTWPEGMLTNTIDALNPKITIESRIKNRINKFRAVEKNEIPRTVENNARLQNASEDELHPVIWYPEFHRPMYHFLKAMSQEYLLPGLENVPQNTVGLLQTNRRFIEAFMVGLNHEMASELRWREFPTDLRGSYFRSFWDTSIYSVDESEKIQFRSTAIGIALQKQIQTQYGDTFSSFPVIEALYAKGDPNEIEKEIADAYESAIEKWLLTRDEDKDIDKLINWKKNNRLGDNPVPGKLNNQEEDQNQMVLLVRGELLQKFRNTLIYLVKKKETDGMPDLDQQATRTFPVFEGALLPDIVFIGFPIKKEEAAGYFVIFEERMTEIRFGLDETPEGSAPGTEENNFSWEHFPTLPPGGYLDGIQPTIFTQEWNNAAFISKVMMQKQVRAAIELKGLLPGF